MHVCQGWAEIEKELSATGYAAIHAAMSGSQGPQRLEEIKEKNLSLQQERQELLRSIHLPEDYLTEPFVCPYCHDEGYRDGKRCECFEKNFKRRGLPPLEQQISSGPVRFFPTLTFLIIPKRRAANHPPGSRWQKSSSFVDAMPKTFSSDSSNLLMSGRTGLGKNSSVSLYRKGGDGKGLRRYLWFHAGSFITNRKRTLFPLGKRLANFGAHAGMRSADTG